MIGLLNKIKKLYRNGFFDIIISGTLAKMVAFFSSIIVVRLLTTREYAILTYVDNIYSYVFLFSGLGMASAMLKFCVDKNEEKNLAYYVFSIKWGTFFQVCIISAACAVVAIADLPFLGSKLLFFMMIPYGILNYWVNWVASFLRTRIKNRDYSIFSLLQVILTFLFSFILTSLFGVSGIAIARTSALILAISTFINKINKYCKGKKTYKLSKTEKKEFIFLGASLLVANLFSMIMPINETFLVNNLIRSEVVSAGYKVAGLIPSQLPFVTSSIMIYFFPLIAKKEKDKDLWQYIKNIGKWTFLINLFITIIGIILTPLIIGIVYGNEYQYTTKLSIILWIVYFSNSGFRMVALNILPALGIVKFNIVMAVFSSITHLLLDYVFIRLWGINGAAIATFIIYMTSGFCYWAYLREKCKERN